MSQDALDDTVIVPGPSKERLNQRQLLDYQEIRREFIEWLLHLGKNPDRAVGYSESTVRQTAYRTDQFFRAVWDERGYTTDVTSEDADAYIRDLTYSDASESHKSNTQKSLLRLFRWRVHTRGGSEWEPPYAFSSGDATRPRDYFTRSERRQLREAALEYGSIPGYNDLTPEQRDRWKGYLAQRFGKPKSDVRPADWERANGWQTPTLVWVSLDCGLRPIEVERAVTSWVDIDNGVLRIPKEQSSKNVDNWIVSLQSRTVRALDRWLTERRAYDRYTGTDALWLTRHGNPYRSQSLRHVLHRLCDLADISTKGRSLSWYSIRASTATYMTHEEDLAAAQAQLRHKSPTTTMRYDQAPIESRRDALDRMG
ncbi:tyrosine-type recombinase/integrase [Halomarina ordinaria]|uniref:Tyrosine-type recombinase/integrase n=1 Tax=Halomarina ordinaria TaxID=3033939 RepID=A0ABD5U4C3_9EURY|nr:site-specific integrase [Halomarina sp. PSRA2]